MTSVEAPATLSTVIGHQSTFVWTLIQFGSCVCVDASRGVSSGPIPLVGDAAAPPLTQPAAVAAMSADATRHTVRRMVIVESLPTLGIRGRRGKGRLGRFAAASRTEWSYISEEHTP